jgi:hypothetical protein
MAKFPYGTYTEKIQIDLSCKEAMGIFSGLAKWQENETETATLTPP